MYGYMCVGMVERSVVAVSFYVHSVCIHVLYMCIGTYMFTLHMYMFVYTYMCLHMYMHLCVCVCVCVCVVVHKEMPPQHI